MTVLVLNGGHRGEADSRSVTVALALVAPSLAIFVGYVAATVRLLQVVSVIAMVARQTLAAIDQSVPAAGLRISRPGPPRSGRSACRRPAAGPGGSPAACCWAWITTG